MDIVDIFLNALQNKINASSGQISDFEEKKNQFLELKNILYTHSILKDEIDERDLISFTSEEINTIFGLLDSEKKDLLCKTFSVYKPLVQTYERIKEKFSGDFEAPQYVEAIKWLKDMARRVSDLIKIGTDPNSSYINDLKTKSEHFNKYYNLFNGNNLVKPISDFKEFNSLLDELNFTDEEKYEIKKFVGISNIKLMSSSYSYVDENEFGKYKVILKNKRDKYNDLFNILKEKNLNFDDINLDELKKELNASEYDLRQALCAVFFEKIFARVNDGMLKVTEAVVELEKVLEFAREAVKEDEPVMEAPEEIQEEIAPEEKVSEKNEEIKEEVKINPDEEIINEAREILKNEKDLINSVDEADFARFLAQSLTEETAESVKYQVVSILISLHTELEKYENVKELEHARKMVVINVRDYIDAYKALNEKLKDLSNK